MRMSLPVAMAVVALTGCASGINRKEMQIHFEAAQRFDVQGDFVSARDHYAKALVNARLSGAPAAWISMLTYNYGRTTGYTCHLDEADTYLRQALEMEKTVTGPDSGVSTKRLMELARLNFDRERYAESAGYYATGLPVLENLGILTSDPIAYADAIDEYAVALARSGKTTDSRAARKKAQAIREQNPGAMARFVPTRYRCPPPN